MSATHMYYFKGIRTEVGGQEEVIQDRIEAFHMQHALQLAFCLLNPERMYDLKYYNQVHEHEYLKRWIGEQGMDEDIMLITGSGWALAVCRTEKNYT